MAWRGVHITTPSSLSLSHGQLRVEQDDRTVSLALEDLAWVVLDTPQVTLSGALLSALSDHGIAMITSDSRHTPSGLFLPFHQHHRQPMVAHRQIGAGAPLKKRLWQAIVRQKIANQAAVLRALQLDGADTLCEMVRHVGSGDTNNVEARAARFYWQRLFTAFKRDDGTDGRNAMLNYGYAVLRAGVARAVTAAGLLPAFGVHHASVQNPFNLADDLIEPFRPLVDRLAYGLTDLGRPLTDQTLDRSHRQTLANVLSEAVLIDAEQLTLIPALDKVAGSLVAAFSGGRAATLALPDL